MWPTRPEEVIQTPTSTDAFPWAASPLPTISLELSPFWLMERKAASSMDTRSPWMAAGAPTEAGKHCDCESDRPERRGSHHAGIDRGWDFDPTESQTTAKMRKEVPMSKLTRRTIMRKGGLAAVAATLAPAAFPEID